MGKGAVLILNIRNMPFKKYKVNMKSSVVRIRLFIKNAKIKVTQAESENKNIDV